MFNAYGWCVLRASREPFREATLGETFNTLVDFVNSEDSRIGEDLKSWLGKPDSYPEFQWTINRHMWDDCPIVLYSASRNHRSSRLWDFLNWVLANAPGSYGLTYVHDDEDIPGAKRFGRGIADYANVFRVIRIANGKLDELEDPFLSPIYPTINPSEHC